LIKTENENKNKRAELVKEAGVNVEKMPDDTNWLELV
jgi:hypothetical protein